MSLIALVLIVALHHSSNVSLLCVRASVEHHGVQPTGCMDNEPEPSRGVPC